MSKGLEEGGEVEEEEVDGSLEEEAKAIAKGWPSLNLVQIQI